MFKDEPDEGDRIELCGHRHDSRWWLNMMGHVNLAEVTRVPRFEQLWTTAARRERESGEAAAEQSPRESPTSDPAASTETDAERAVLVGSSADQSTSVFVMLQNKVSKVRPAGYHHHHIHDKERSKTYKKSKRINFENPEELTSKHRHTKDKTPKAVHSQYPEDGHVETQIP